MPKGYKTAKVRAREEAVQRELRRLGLDAQRVKLEMARLATSSVRDLFDEQGELLPIHKLPKRVAASVASVEVVMKNAAAGDGQVDRVLKIRLWPKDRALEMLGKHFGLLIERIEHSGGVELLSRLDKGRLRAAGRGGA